MNKNLKTEATAQTVLTLDELVSYCGYKKGYIYQLIHKRKIPAHKPPTGRKLFFQKAEIDEWLLTRKLETIGEIKKSMFN